MVMSAHPKHRNRLAGEKSPYLLQHAPNPVDWFAWNEEAFAKARSENLPIFLSIGYSTCHWCHVMERESFEDEKIAAFLKTHFVSIKVDREERPDVDKIYMTFVQATTGSGGWPMSVFLTPALKPFFGGTYFPPTGRHGRPGFLQLLEQIAGLWRERRTEIVASADELHARLELFTARDEKKDSTLAAETVRSAAEQFKRAYDAVNGGFGQAPKFPQPGIPLSLLRAAKRFGDKGALGMVLHTCERMAAGGIHDQLGGGFARYAVDTGWLVPHFEKMLYDNAQLVQLYLDAFLAGGDPRHAETARDILDYVLCDMTHPAGGFYSAEDADSEGHEGKFYCWTTAELSRLLTNEEYNVAVKCFGITPAGNFLDHSHPTPLPGQNVLSLVQPAEAEGGPSSANDRVLLAAAKAKMLGARAKRVRPHLDDKILASWNGLMLGAFARAGVILGDEKYQAAARKNVEFLRKELWDEQNRALFHRWREGERDQVELLEGYAFALDGVIHLYETTLVPADLDFAIKLAEAMLAKFYDAANGGFWQTLAGAQDLILRVKDDYDGAEPSGNSVATMAMLKLGAITGREKFTQAAEATLQLFAHRLQAQPAGLAGMLQALDFRLDEPRRVVIGGVSDSPQFKELIQAAHSIYEPNKIVMGNKGAVEPFAQTLTAKTAATAWVCSGQACQPPAQDAATLRQALTA
jgi:uncharacterized protein YyaL (SSP411 family)